MTVQPLDRLDPEEVRYVYWRAQSNDADLPDLEVSYDDGITWTALESADDPDDQPAYRALLAGPGVSDPGSARVLPAGFTFGLTRVADTPEIAVQRWRIEVTPRT